MNEPTEASETASADRNERAKKLYRYVTEVARRIDEAHTASHSIADIFSTYLEVQRQKLYDNCEKLMFLDLQNYGKKSLDLVWRKVYYETISTSKKYPEFGDHAKSHLFTHIMSGIGHFHCLVSKIQTEKELTIKDIDFCNVYKDEENYALTAALLSEEQQIARTMIYSCLIYLGDLCRYQHEIFYSFNCSISARYYLQAAHVDLSSGMPYNQLGNLYLDKNYNLDSVCYYIHCLSCMEPFEGAMGNLTKLFERNNQFTEELEKSETLTQTEHIQSTIAQFISLIELWYMGQSDTDIPQRCAKIAQELKISMELEQLPLPNINKNYDEYTQAMEDELIHPTYLNASAVHKMVVICLFTMAKLNETDEKKAFTCKAFTLALFSQLLHKFLIQIKALGFKNPADKYRRHSIPLPKQNSVTEDTPPKMVPNVVENGANVEKKEPVAKITVVEDTSKTIPATEKSPEKVVCKKASKRRRRRRATSSDSSGQSDDEDSDNSESESHEDDSSNEDISNSSDDDSDNDKTDNCAENDCSESELNGNTNLRSTPEEPLIEKDQPNGSNTVEDKDIEDLNEMKKSPEGFDEIGIQNFLQGNNVLPSIKLLTDWVLTEKDLILSCGESGDSLFQCIVDLLNILTHHFKSDTSDSPSCNILDYCKSLVKNLELEYKTIPLPEDINLRGTNICKFDKDAAEWQILNRYSPSVYEENTIRILYFIDFGNQIAKIIPRIRLNRPLQVLYLKRSTPPKVHKDAKGNHKRTREWHNSKNEQSEDGEGALLQRLGRLWLASRVRELERYGRSAAAAAAPTLLALDATALYKHLRPVKQLLKARSFVLLIPTIVLQELDDLKREEISARDAIRWLELQLQSGSRFVRAQRTGQSRPLPLLKYPRKAPAHIHNFIQILEFCHHLVGDETSQGGNGDTNSMRENTPQLVLLTGNDLGKSEDTYKDFSITGAAKSAGISIEYIESFYSKWKQSAPKSGKKR